jgi:flagellar export protein FliJ
MFVFRFRSLLQLAVSQRDTARSSLAEAMEALSRLQQQRQQLAAQRNALMSDESLSRLGTMRVDGLLAQGRFERQLAIEDSQLLAAEHQIEAEIDRRRAVLRIADTELRRLEMLQEKDQRAWAAGQAKAEQAMLDEIAARRTLPADQLVDVTESQPWP